MLQSLLLGRHRQQPAMALSTAQHCMVVCVKVMRGYENQGGGTKLRGHTSGQQAFVLRNMHMCVQQHTVTALQRALPLRKPPALPWCVLCCGVPLPRTAQLAPYATPTTLGT